MITNPMFNEKQPCGHDLVELIYACGTCANKVAAELASLRERLASALEVLRCAEWGGGVAGGQRTCVICNSQERRGHKRGCALAALLENKGEGT